MTATAPDRSQRRPRIALVLPGGGARSAYQVGVLRAISGWLPRGAPLPFAVVCGTSAGAINAAVLAAHGPDMRRACEELARVWGGFRLEQVFRSGAVDMLRSGLRLFLSLISGGFLLPMPRALLDNSPLRNLLARNVDFESLRRTLRSGAPDSIAVTATSVSGSESVTFVESARDFLPWSRASRRGVAVRLDVDHLMASAAIPLLFPTVVMDTAHFSDGAMRQLTPLAPAIHLGAERILVIGSRRRGRTGDAAPPPSLAEQFGFMLDSLFMEGVEADLERLNRINSLLAQVRAEPIPFDLRQIETLLMLPERDPSEIAIAHRTATPGTLRALLRVLGARGARGGQLLSFLLFESPYTRELIDAGQHDAETRRSEIRAFLDLDRSPAAIGAK